MSEQHLKDTYSSLVEAYVASQEEQYLARAADLGRQLVLANVPLEDLAEIHQEAIGRLAEEFPDKTLLESAGRVFAPLMEMLMAYGLAFRETLDERKRVEEALRESEEFSSSLLSSTPDPIIVIHPDTSIKYVNPALEMLTGFSLTELVGRKAPYPWWTEETLEETAQDLEQAMEGGANRLEELFQKKNREQFWVQITSVPVRSNGGLKYYLASWVDITGRRRAEEALRESEERLRRVVGSLPIILYSAEGGTNRFLLITGAVREILGRDPEYFLKNPDQASELVHPDDRVYVGRTFKQGLDSLKPFELEYRIVHGIDGRTVWVREYHVPIVGPNGRIIRQDGVILNVTDQKSAEQEREQMQAQLLRAQKLESIGVLAGGIAHDFNNMLTVISGNAQFLSKRLRLDATQAGALEDINAAATHAAEMTRSLQAFSRPSEPRIQRTDANYLIQEVCRLLRRMIPGTIHFRLDLDASPCMIAADPGQMQQVLVNLCVNARDAMPTGGVLEIRTRRVGAESLPPHAEMQACSDGYVGIRVSDSGCGMDADTLERVFDPFFTTKAPDRGTGLGLAIAYKIVEAHHGTIDVASRPGEGTCFDLFFPLAGPSPVEETEAEISSARGEERILVVEDEEMVGSLLGTVLESRGYQVTLTHRSEEALEAARSSAEPFDLAIVDYSLPGNTGDRCLAEIRGAQPDIKAILITAYDIGAGDLPDADCWILHKPFSVTAMAQMVRDVLDR